MTPDRIFVGLGALSGLVAVAAGAFGAHALRERLGPELLSVFETGVRYQMYHALALLGCAWAYARWGVAPIVWSGWLFALGSVIFSGSLYLLALTGIRWLAAVTPLGGACFLAGWLALAWAAFAGTR